MNDTSCPSHKPYCTTAGCVYECPEGSLIDGVECVEDCDRMVCVVDCGQRFIHNRSCVSTCPTTHPFTTEKVHMRGIRYFKQKICSEKCPDDTFLYKGICEHACPSEAQYSFNGSCVEQCPDTHQFERNITKNGRFISRECLVNCSGQFPVRRGQNTCLAICCPPLVQYNSTCFDKCPSEADLTMDSISTKGTTRNCIDSCPEGWHLFYNSCIPDCPLDHKVYNNSVCVRDCPDNAPFETSYADSSPKVLHKNKSSRCVPNCEGLYYNNNTCVDICSVYTLENKTCIESCPDSAPFVCDQKLDIRCAVNNQPYGSRRRITVCLEKCPDKMFMNNNSNCVGHCPAYTLGNGSCVASCPDSAPFISEQRHSWHYASTVGVYLVLLCKETCPVDTFLFNSTTCLSSCPIGMNVYNGSCVVNCPEKSPFVTNNQCVENCPNDLYIDEFSCLQTCPESKYHLIRNMTCFEKCPQSAPLMYDKHLLQLPSQLLLPNRLCLEMCPENTNSFNKTCVSFCPSGFKNYNNACVENCPSESPFVHTPRSCYHWYDRNCLHSHCIEECTGDLFTDGYNCVEHCPNNKYSFESNRTCLDKCPNTHRFPVVGWGASYCGKKCPEEAFYNDGRCVRQCDRKFKFSNLCVTKCPSTHPLIKDGFCVSGCPKDWYIDNKKCIEHCSGDLFISGSMCVEECPPSRPFLQSNILDEPRFCEETCGYFQVSVNGSCIVPKDCRAEIIFDDKCLHQCPNRYIWIARTTERVEDKPFFPLCHSKVVISVMFAFAIILSLASTMMYWWCFWPTFIELLFCRTSHKLVSMLSVFRNIFNTFGI